MAPSTSPRLARRRSAGNPPDRGSCRHGTPASGLPAKAEVRIGWETGLAGIADQRWLLTSGFVPLQPGCLRLPPLVGTASPPARDPSPSDLAACGSLPSPGGPQLKGGMKRLLPIHRGGFGRRPWRSREPPWQARSIVPARDGASIDPEQSSTSVPQLIPSRARPRCLN